MLILGGGIIGKLPHKAMLEAHLARSDGREPQGNEQYDTLHLAPGTTQPPPTDSKAHRRYSAPPANPPW